MQFVFWKHSKPLEKDNIQFKQAKLYNTRAVVCVKVVYKILIEDLSLCSKEGAGLFIKVQNNMKYFTDGVS